MCYYYNIMPMTGVIGGSGLYDLPGLKVTEQRELETPYGKPSGAYAIGEISGTEVAFLPRHGPSHSIAPHRINYRANLRGFSDLGVRRIISVSAAGGIKPGLRPGDIVLLEQVIDMTQGARASTFYEEEDIVHIDFTDPYCPEMAASVVTASKRAGVGLADTGAAYICVNGPRLESRAEIKYFSTMGADVVGMTAMPEACLARELEICFCGLCVVTNPAAGIAGDRLSAKEVVVKMQEADEKVKALVKEAVSSMPAERTCHCQHALKQARL